MKYWRLEMRLLLLISSFAVILSGCCIATEKVEVHISAGLITSTVTSDQRFDQKLE